MHFINKQLFNQLKRYKSPIRIRIEKAEPINLFK